LKGEGNQIQFTFNSDLITDLQKVQKHIPVEDSTAINILSELILKLNKRNKFIRIAGKSPQVGTQFESTRAMILEYNSEDEKCLRSTKNRYIGRTEKRIETFTVSEVCTT
jgi:hypothetical protein